MFFWHQQSSGPLDNLTRAITRLPYKSGFTHIDVTFALYYFLLKSPFRQLSVLAMASVVVTVGIYFEGERNVV